ncbi:MAG: DUF4097 family beta strand repeat protein [Clostridia bacterium]|nr:DUF4097 family beta strand repeat protein [Clostridia bacterium]
MRTRTKVWLIIAAFLVLIGCFLFLGIMSMLEWDFAKLSTFKYETNNYEIAENFNNISIITDTADILFVPSETPKASVVCHEQKNAKHSVTVNNGKIIIKIVDTRKWYEHIGINLGTPKITIYIPQNEYGTLFVKSSTGNVEIPKEFKFKNIDITESTGNVTNYASASENIIIKTSTGYICVEDVSANTLDLSVSTGEIAVSNVTCESDVKINVSTGKANLTNIECKKVVSNGDTGDIYLNNTIATEKFFIERSTGDIKFNKCDAAEIFVETDTGDITGSLLADKIFIVQTDTGNVNVPKTATGGKCEITTATGDINIRIKQ